MLKHIKEIKVHISPFNTKSKSARLFLSRIITNESKESNPNCKVVTNYLTDNKAPSNVQVVFRDGKQFDLRSNDMKIDDILTVVQKHSKKLQELEDSAK
ncbi:hypothetical protein K493DRAFT_206840 [Basidiobolus meristosporus CBS 931.73]|uniref:Large ribosomal subunit protein mL53 n=1 Tax=Basidiobolus meristosporus CBS 931.73 TaxID=1314790 RepID=A0A1Y1Z005_9FUNG|nr:hypothetical protein K493DRAFT_206840 [Basidiobolus meristosporus CBS 931.73]|eukprot:ORY03618.1 hypothetical protein K493DRAFT_206840 [Basidiobolus meristosporus CBS 931.73]